MYCQEAGQEITFTARNPKTQAPTNNAFCCKPTESYPRLKSCLFPCDIQTKTLNSFRPEFRIPHPPDLH